MQPTDYNDSMPGLPPVQAAGSQRAGNPAAEFAEIGMMAVSIGDQWANKPVDRFRRGEKVVCLDASDNESLVQGAEYEVDADYGDINNAQMVYLVGHPDNCPFAAHRFARPNAIPLTETQKAEVLNWASAEERGVKLPEAGDEVNLPPHYARFKIEPIRFLVENFGPSILVGKIVKYSMRYDGKNGLQDIDKAIRCAQMLRAFVAGDPDWWQRRA